jgi:hypothetical protein
VAEEREAEPSLEAARRLHDLSLDYAARSHAAVAALVSAFEVQAAGLTDDIGELIITDADDERLVLTAHGQFAGRVLTDDPTPRWQTLDSPDDIAEHYDPVDLFADVADAVAEAFLGVDDDEVPSDAPDIAPARSGGEVRSTAGPEPSFVAPPTDDSGDSEAPNDSPPAQESATLRVLENLHAAGILTDADFEAKKAELDR